MLVLFISQHIARIQTVYLSRAYSGVVFALTLFYIHGQNHNIFNNFIMVFLCETPEGWAELSF